MIKPAYLLFMLLYANLSYAGFGTIYYFKCRIVTNDTTVVGYFNAYPEQTISDSVLVKLKTNKRYFEDEILKSLGRFAYTSTSFELNRFIFVHNYSYPGKGVRETAIFTSQHKLNINIKTILRMELLEIVTFQFAPNRVITRIEEKDKQWLNMPVKKIIQSEDKCYPYRFLIYDDTIDFNKIIKHVLQDPDKMEAMIEGLSKYKILGLHLNLCD